jgi:hypothetical protein
MYAGWAQRQAEQPWRKSAANPAGERANAEAEARRKATQPAAMPRELGGPKGPEPTRYGDWEKKGITSDF